MVYWETGSCILLRSVKLLVCYNVRRDDCVNTNVITCAYTCMSVLLNKYVTVHTCMIECICLSAEQCLNLFRQLWEGLVLEDETAFKHANL